MTQFIALLLILIYPFFTNAAYDGYTVSVLGQRSIDYSKPTHVIIAGYAHDKEQNFQNAGASQGVKYLDSNPEHQVVMIANLETPIMNEVSRLQSWGFNVVENPSTPLNKKSLILEVGRFDQIASLDLYGHGNITYGLQLGFSRYIGARDVDLGQLKSRFMEDTYATIYGCNQGFFLAPALSEIWEIPVSAALTSTNYHQLHSSNEFYVHDDLLKPPGDWSLENILSFQLPRKCENAGCLRMKPDNHPYDGMHGRYEAGLPFMKFFCVKTPVEKCQKIMALSLNGFLDTRRMNSPDAFNDYKYIVQNFLCPVHKSNGIHETCRRQLQASEVSGKETYNPFLGRTLQCDFKGCEFQLDCTQGSSCLIRSSKKKTTTLIREYKNYLQGFTYLLPDL